MFDSDREKQGKKNGRMNLPSGTIDSPARPERRPPD
jgi:hypothetical protein